MITTLYILKDLLTPTLILCLVSCLMLFGCASPRTLKVVSSPEGADVYLKGFNKEYFPENKVRVGSTPYLDSRFEYTDEAGKTRSVDYCDLEAQDFFVILEKGGYEARSLYAPPYDHHAHLKAENESTQVTSNFNENQNSSH